jgi:hypothetical protein
MTQHLLESKVGADAGDARNLRQLVDDEALKRRHVAHDDADQVVEIAGHQVTLPAIEPEAAALASRVADPTQRAAVQECHSPDASPRGQ